MVLLLQVLYRIVHGRVVWLHQRNLVVFSLGFSQIEKLGRILEMLNSLDKIAILVLIDTLKEVSKRLHAVVVLLELANQS